MEMDFLVEELDSIISEFTKIRDNMKNGINFRRMKELCVERRLALESYGLKYDFNRPTGTGYGHPINRSHPDDDSEDKIG